MSLIVSILLALVRVCYFRLHASSHHSHFDAHLVFHHDGPFDACAPSRNKHRTKAPMYAWTSINPEDEEVVARYRNNEDGPSPVNPTFAYDASYPSDANDTNYYYEPPKKKVDALAEAWGMAEPEPYEEFFAGGSDSDRPITHGNSMIREPRTSGRRARDDLPLRPRVPNRSIPPPQPIFVPTAPEAEPYPSQPSPDTGGANLGRNRSLMQRIRKMRDSPNVPVTINETTGTPGDGVPSPTSSAESGGHGHSAYRPRDSLLGRFVRQGRGDSSPTTPVEPYVYVRGGDVAKDLPATPASPGDGQQDRGLGRKTSILKRVKGVVRGSK
jgi:hypothetical protein